MIVSNRADRVGIRAVICADVDMARPEDLQVPVRRLAGLVEALRRQKVQARPVVARRHDGNVGFDEFFATGAAFRHAMAALVEVDAGAAVVEGDDVAAKPGSFAVADRVQNIIVDHGRVGIDAFAVWWRREVVKLLVAYGV